MLERWEEPSLPQAPVFNIYGDTYGSKVGTQGHAQVIRPTFTFRDLEQEIDRRGEDVEALRAMVREIRETLESQDSLNRGWLLGWSELINSTRGSPHPSHSSCCCTPRLGRSARDLDFGKTLGIIRELPALFPISFQGLRL